MMTALTIIHVVISLALVVVVLLQHGKQQGLSGAIAGGAETFFGKNKGRTVDAMLKKFTAVVAILFIASSIVFTTVAVNNYKEATKATEDAATTQEAAPATQQLPMDENGNLLDENGNVIGKFDDKGNLVDQNGNIQVTAEQMQQAQQAQQAAPAENATPAASTAPAASAAPVASEAPKN